MIQFIVYNINIEFDITNYFPKVNYLLSRGLQVHCQK